MKRFLLAAAKVAALLVCIWTASMVGGALVAVTRDATASRDGAGTYTFPANSVNPAVAGTPIKSADWNTFRTDLTAGLTDSLSRSGSGGMTAILTQSVSGTGTTDLAQFFEPSLANGNISRVWTGKATTANNGGFMSFTPNATAANSTNCLAVAGQNTTLCVDGTGLTTAGTTKLGTTTIGAGGTTIGASKVVTPSVTWGTNCTSPGTLTTTVAVTNIAFGDSCSVAAPANMTASQIPVCYVSAAGTVTYGVACLVGTAAPPNGTWTVRTFQAAN